MEASRTASLRTADRSRDGMESNEPSGFQNKVKKVEPILAGPMVKRDRLHVINLVLTIITIVITSRAVTDPGWFFLVDLAEPWSGTPAVIRLQSAGKTASLFGIKSCSSNLEMWEICFGSESKFGLGDWVTVVQRVSVSGLGLLSISLLIQVVHLFLKQRNKAMQAVSLLAVANGGLLLMVAGHIAHNRTVWADDLKNADGSIILKVSPLSGGLMLLGVVMSGAICVLSHVASHSPGPLSTNTRFHLSYDTGSGDDIVPTHQLRLDEITCQDDVTRRTSQRSTEI